MRYFELWQFKYRFFDSSFENSLHLIYFVYEVSCVKDETLDLKDNRIYLHIFLLHCWEHDAPGIILWQDPPYFFMFTRNFCSQRILTVVFCSWFMCFVLSFEFLQGDWRLAMRSKVFISQVNLCKMFDSQRSGPNNVLGLLSIISSKIEVNFTCLQNF